MARTIERRRDLLRAYVDRTFPNQSMTWLMGMLETKDHAGVFAELLRAGDRLHLVPVPGHLSASPDALKAIAQKICPGLTTETRRKSYRRTPLSRPNTAYCLLRLALPHRPLLRALLRAP